MPQKVHMLSNNLREHVARMILTQHDFTIESLQGEKIITATWNTLGLAVLYGGILDSKPDGSLTHPVEDLAGD